MEVLVFRHRTKVGIFYHVWFALGYMLLACVAYFVRSHTYLQLYLGLSALAFISYWWYDQIKVVQDKFMHTNTVREICSLVTIKGEVAD